MGKAGPTPEDLLAAIGAYRQVAASCGWENKVDRWFLDQEHCVVCFHRRCRCGTQELDAGELSTAVGILHLHLSDDATSDADIHSELREAGHCSHCLRGLARCICAVDDDSDDSD